MLRPGLIVGLCVAVSRTDPALLGEYCCRASHVTCHKTQVSHDVWLDHLVYRLPHLVLYNQQWIPDQALPSCVLCLLTLLILIFYFVLLNSFARLLQFGCDVGCKVPTIININIDILASFNDFIFNYIIRVIVREFDDLMDIHLAC